MKTEKGHFLSPELKEVKQEIMEALMSDIFDIVKEKSKIMEIDDQAHTDIVISCLIMFTRDVILTIIGNSNARNEGTNFTSHLLLTIANEVNRKLDND